MGKAMATKLAPNHQVVILSHNEEKLKSVSASINCDYINGDVTDYSSLEKAVKRVIEKYRGIDVLINNAGIWTQGMLEDSDPKTIEEVIKVNTLGTIFLSKAVIPFLKLQGHGRIINIVSRDGLIAKKDRSVYSASKWAITGFSKCLVEDLSPSNISVTAIYPGLLKTALFEKQGAQKDLTNALDLEEVATLAEFVINLPADTLLSEISIKNINNPTNMDDTTVPQIGLDINPDMITPQSSVPTMTPSSTTTTTTTDVIDITPGAKEETHPSPTTDITPSVNSTITPAINLPVDRGVIDITPSTTLTTHLTDIMPQVSSEVTTTTSSTTDIPPISTSGSTATPPANISSASTPITETTTVSTPTTTTEVITTSTVSQEVPASPYAEDPDSVHLGK